MQTTIIGQKCLLLDSETKKILVIQRSDYKKDGGKWDLIGGSVEFGEELSEAIKREAEEETGIRLYDIRPLHVTSRLFTDDDNKFFVLVLRVCDSWKYIGETIRLSDEHTAWQRVDRATFDKLELRDTIIEIKPQIKELFH